MTAESIKPCDIKFHLEPLLSARRDEFAGKVALDFPAGEGRTSALLASLGAKVEPFDLFPDTFRAAGLACRRADIRSGIPVPDGHADWIVCQEGIEHFQDQRAALAEFARALKPGGRLLVTTPNGSNLKARLSHLLLESEYAGKLMPPNERDSVWRDEAGDTYLGHIFLIGIQKLRCLARLAGFRVARLHRLRLCRTSLALAPLLYPAVALAHLLTRRRALRGKAGEERARAAAIYDEQTHLGMSAAALLATHLVVEFVREAGSCQWSVVSG